MNLHSVLAYCLPYIASGDGLGIHGESEFVAPIINQTPKPKTSEELESRAERRKKNRQRKANLKAKGRGRR